MWQFVTVQLSQRHGREDPEVYRLEGRGNKIWQLKAIY